MKKLFVAFAVTVILIFCGLFAYCDTEADRGFSPWLAHDPFELWLKENVSGKHLYIAAAEGRLHDGISEWRVRPAPVLENVEWYWWYDMDQKFYEARVDDLVKKRRFKQVWVQSFLNEKGEQDYQSIFVKF